MLNPFLLWYYSAIEMKKMENKITIIEGPPPVFERINDGWTMGMNESPILYDTIFTQVRTMNGPSLVERCHRTWNEGNSIYLHFKNDLGVEEKLPIVAARAVESKDGQVLLLWIRQLPSLEDLKLMAEDFEDEFDLDDEDLEDLDEIADNLFGDESDEEDFEDDDLDDIDLEDDDFDEDPDEEEDEMDEDFFEDEED